MSPHFPARLNNCRRQHGALSRSSFSPVVASSCFMCTRELRVRKACGGGLPKLNRNDGNHLKGAWPSKYRPGWCHRLFTVAFFYFLFCDIDKHGRPYCRSPGWSSGSGGQILESVLAANLASGCYPSYRLLPIHFSIEIISWPIVGFCQPGVEGLEYLQWKDRNRPHSSSREIW